jgi:hypothetical protein
MRKAVIAGTGSNDTAHTVMLTREAKSLGAAGVIVVAPYYSRPPQAGIEAHFRAAAQATDLPVMLYDGRCAPAGASAATCCGAFFGMCRTSSRSRTRPAIRLPRPH